jgi:sugar phosphate isomerase/epimerase
MQRREVLASGAAVVGAALASSLPREAPAVESLAVESSSEPFGYCLNTSTLRGQGLGIVEELTIAAEVGYQGVEPWIRELQQYVQSGGSLKDLRKRIDDLGLVIPSAIGFAEWIVDDDARRAKGLETARSDMGMLAEIGALRLAAPPSGATRDVHIELPRAAERYAVLCKLGQSAGIAPEVEVWGHSSTLGRLAEAVYVAVASNEPNACLLPDIYHLHKGGSGFQGLSLLGPNAIHVFHVNDYPAEPPIATLADADRVYPGDGVAPLDFIFRTLRDIGFTGMLSLELFNKSYWQQDARLVARTGLEKTRSAVKRALA